MTTLLQTRVDPHLAARFKAAAKAKGKSAYQALRELAEHYADHASRRPFASAKYTDTFALPDRTRFGDELRRRMSRGHAKHH